MTNDTTTKVMVPGILVALKSHVRGGVQYQRSVMEDDADGRVTKWETTRFMEDPAERKRAGEVAGEASRLISKLCVRTSFGLLCPVDKEKELDVATREMRSLTAEWNRRQATHSFVYVSAIKGRIADNDEEALRAIIDEATDLMAQMERGMTTADVKEIREAASRAKRLSEMMTPDASAAMNAALKAARETAKVVVKRGEDLGDRVTKAMLEVEQERFGEARFAFLEAAPAGMVTSVPSVNLQRGAELEIDGPSSAVLDDQGAYA